MKKRILVALSSMHDCRRTSDYLEERGYSVTVSCDSEDAMNKSVFQEFDLVLLGIRFKKKSGIHVLSEIRKRKGVPIIMLSSDNNEIIKNKCIEMQADDVMIMPCCDETLIRRIESHINGDSPKRKMINYKDIFMDMDRKVVTKGDENIEMGNIEMSILEALINAKGRVISRDYINEDVYGSHNMRDGNTITCHVNNIRKKLCSDLIISVKGSGYRINI